MWGLSTYPATVMDPTGSSWSLANHLWGAHQVHSERSRLIWTRSEANINAGKQTYQCLHILFRDFKIKHIKILLNSALIWWLGDAHKPSLNAPSYHHLCRWFAVPATYLSLVSEAQHAHSSVYVCAVWLRQLSYSILPTTHFWAIETRVGSRILIALASGEYAMMGIPSCSQ